MKDKIRQLERLERLREARERLQQAMYVRARTRVATRDREIVACVAARDKALEQGLAGLVRGERDPWQTGRQVAALAEVVAQRLQQERIVCEQEMNSAQLLYAQSHRAVEQARLLLGRSRAALQREEERQAQAASDDRFAARAHWLASRTSIS